MDQSATELRVEIAETRANLGETLEAIGDRVSPGRVVERRKNRMVRGLSTAKDRIMGTAQSATDHASDSMHDATDNLQHAPQAIRDRSAGNPLVAGGVAFGIGLLAAAAMPPTRKEREFAEQMSDRIEPLKQEVMEEAKAVASEAAEHLQQPAKEAVDEVRQTAQASAEHMKETVKQDQPESGSARGTQAPTTPPPTAPI